MQEKYEPSGPSDATYLKEAVSEYKDGGKKSGEPLTISGSEKRPLKT